MNLWQRWVKRPQRIWLRRALFQIHLWSGIGLGLYVFVVFLSGSAAVFNSELYAAFLPNPKMVEIAGTRLSRDELKAIVLRAHPGAHVTGVAIRRNPHEAAVASLGVGPFADQRFVDPYTGKDLGTAKPFGLRMVSFFSQLHMDLLMGYHGRLANGVGGFLTAALSLTGLVIWWPGIREWRESLTVRFGANFKRLNWQLHSTIGFWTFAIVFMWAITGAYLVYPRQFNMVMNLSLNSVDRFSISSFIHSLHVGDFAGWPIKALWVILGLAPPVLFVTGFIMWWNRVLSPWARRRLGEQSRVKPTPLPVPARMLQGR